MELYGSNTPWGRILVINPEDWEQDHQNCFYKHYHYSLPFNKLSYASEIMSWKAFYFNDHAYRWCDLSMRYCVTIDVSYDMNHVYIKISSPTSLKERIKFNFLLA